MSAPRQVRAQWALGGKRPRDLEHGILSASGGEPNFGYYGDLIALVNPGQPESDSETGATALPWVSFLGALDVEGNYHVGLRILEPGDGVDNAQRGIRRTRFFWFAAAQLAPDPWSYSVLWDAVREVPLSDGTPDTLQIRFESESEISGVDTLYNADVYSETAFGGGGYGSDRNPSFAWAAAVAATLLDTSVLITDYPGGGVHRALRDLEAVLALLPYGLRSTLTLATWTNTGETVHRLAFGTGVGLNRRKCRRVSWREPSALGQLSDTARRYRDALFALAEPDRPGDTASQAIRRLVAGLRGSREPHGFDDAGAAWALETLQGLNLPLAVHRTLTDGTGHLRTDNRGRLSSSIAAPEVFADVIRILRNFPSGGLNADRVGLLVHYVHKHDDRRGLETLVQHWSNSSGPAQIAEYCRASWEKTGRSADAGTAQARRFLDAAEQVAASPEDAPAALAALDAFWAQLANPAGHGRDKEVRSRTRALWITWDRRYTTLLPATLAQFVANEPLCQLLLAGEVSSGRRGEDMVRMLEGARQPGAWFHPLRFALPENARAVDERELATLPGNVLSLLVTLAMRCGTLDDILAAACPLLLPLAAPRVNAASPHKERDYLADFLDPEDAQRRPKVATAHGRAALDLIRVLLEARPDSLELVHLGVHEAVPYADKVLQITSASYAAGYQERYAQVAVDACLAPGRDALGATTAVLGGLMRAAGPGATAVATGVVKELRRRSGRIGDPHLQDAGFWTALGGACSPKDREYVNVQILARGVAQAAAEAGPAAGGIAQAWQRAEGSCTTLQLLQALERWAGRESLSAVREVFGAIWPDSGQSRTKLTAAEDHVIEGVWGERSSAVLLQSRLELLDKRWETVAAREARNSQVHLEALRAALDVRDTAIARAEAERRQISLDARAARDQAEARYQSDAERNRAWHDAEMRRIAEEFTRLDEESRRKRQTDLDDTAQLETIQFAESGSRLDAILQQKEREINAAQQSLQDIQAKAEDDRRGLTQERQRSLSLAGAVDPPGTSFPDNPNRGYQEPQPVVNSPRPTAESDDVTYDDRPFPGQIRLGSTEPLDGRGRQNQRQQPPRNVPDPPRSVHLDVPRQDAQDNAAPVLGSVSGSLRAFRHSIKSGARQLKSRVNRSQSPARGDTATGSRPTHGG